jgi:hypothetical protein
MNASSNGRRLRSSWSPASRQKATRKSVRKHFHYALFAEILQDLAKTVSKMPPADAEHRNVLREGAKALYRALGAGGDANRSKKRGAPESAADPSQMTPEEEVLLLHVME